MTRWTIALQPPLSVGFSRQEYWSGLPFSSPGDLPNTGNEPESPPSPALQANSLLLSNQAKMTLYFFLYFYFPNHVFITLEEYYFKNEIICKTKN